jgi:hypothetical protein
MNASNKEIVKNEKEVMQKWFDDLVSSIRVDQLELETNTASAEKERIYNNFISGNHIETMTEMRSITSKAFIQELVFFYLKELKQRAVQPEKLAFVLSDAKILVWAEIKDNDDSSEDHLLLAEAKPMLISLNMDFMYPQLS